MVAPLIGITTTRVMGKHNRLRDAMSHEYSEAVIRGGGNPVLIPLTLLEIDGAQRLRELYERLDGVVIPGGGDVHPEFYGEYLSDQHRGVLRLRDQVEITLARWAYEDDRPLFGICRGHQVLNVALGGTLIHDIPTALNGKDLQHDQDAEITRARIAHDVAIESGTKLIDLIGQPTLGVNSLHHQAVRDLAPPLIATAFSDDGIIEGIEVPGAYFYVGVQWHPEAIVDVVPEMMMLFQRFVEACAAR